MSNKSGKKDNFLLQAGVLAAAGLISRVIGLLYRSPLTAIIGDLGNGYYQAAYNFYTIVLLISSYSIPSAISKVIAQKLAVREYRNAQRVFLCSIGYVLAVGGVASLFLFFGAGLLVEGNAIPVLRVLAPTVFFYGLLGVLRGYFQAHKSMMQTSVSQILEQIANAVVAIVMALTLIGMFVGGKDLVMKAGEGVESSPVLQGIAVGVVDAGLRASQTMSRAMYGAMGSAIGTGAGVLVGLIFMAGVYQLNRGWFQKRIKRDRTERVDSYQEISRGIVSVVTPFILSTAAYNLSTTVNSVVYLRLYRTVKDIDEITAYVGYGVFSGKAVTISNIPIAFASAMASAALPSVAQLMAQRNKREAHRKIGLAVKSTMLISIPSAVGLFVLAKPVMQLLFPQPESLELASKLLMAMAVSVIFFALSTLSSSILQGIGKVNTPIYHAVAALGVQTAVLAGLLLLTNLDLYALVIANIVYSGLMCFLNQWAVRRAIGYRQEIRRTFLIPLAASCLMGAAAWALYELFHMLTAFNVLSLLVAIPAAAAVYFLFLITLRGVNEEELKSLPKGYLLVKAVKRVGILR